MCNTLETRNDIAPQFRGDLASLEEYSLTFGLEKCRLVQVRLFANLRNCAQVPNIPLYLTSYARCAILDLQLGLSEPVSKEDPSSPPSPKKALPKAGRERTREHQKEHIPITT